MLPGSAWNIYRFYLPKPLGQVQPLNPKLESEGDPFDAPHFPWDRDLSSLVELIRVGASRRIPVVPHWYVDPPNL